MTRRVAALVSILLLIICFVSLNVAANALLRGAHLDLTAGHLYTLSEGSKRILSQMKEPITLRLYFSEKLSAEYETVNSHGLRVRSLLQQFASYAHGNLKLEFVDPEPFGPDEELADAYGLTGAQIDSGERVFLGVVGTNLVDGKEVIPFLSPDREVYLEYDLAALISHLSQAAKPKVGVITSLPLEFGPGGYLAAMQGGQVQPYVVYEQLKQAFELQTLDQNVRAIPDDIQTLLIAHPPALSPQALYAIDQFALRGGRVVALLDPFSESSAPGAMGQQPGAVISSNMAPLLAAWGVDFDSQQLVLDKARAIQVQYGQGDQAAVMPYLAWLKLTGADINRKDLISASIESLQFASAGSLMPIAGATTSFTPLASTSDETQMVPSSMMQYGGEPQALLSGFKSEKKVHVLAARVNGPIKTAFPDGPPPEPVTPEGEAPPPQPEEPLPAPIKASEAPFNLIVVADADFLEDRFWVNVQDFLGQRVAQPTSGNGFFVVNAVDQMMGSDDLISLRSRSRSDRPFTVVQAIERKAQDKFRVEEERLQTQIDETEQRLKELQGQPKKADSLVEEQVTSPVLSPAQEQEVRNFEAQLIKSKRALNEVKRELRVDVIRLGGWVKFINIAFVPLIVAAGAVVLAILRRRKRIAARLAAAQAGG